MNETDNEVIKILKEHPEYTKEQLADLTGRGARTIQRSLDKIKKPCVGLVML